MWKPESIAVQRVSLDFRSSGMGVRRDRALRADDVEISNAIGLVHFSEDPVQVVVCPSCGFTHCESGGWVVFRRLGDGVVVIPAFDRMMEDDRALMEYAPPAFVMRKGAALFQGKVLRRMRRVLDGAADPSALRPLSGAEVARLLQWEAPNRVLGRFPEALVLERGEIVAVDSGDRDIQLEQLDGLLARCTSMRAELVEATAAVTFYVDGGGSSAWSPLAHGADGEPLLHLGAGVVVALRQHPASVPG